jgi:phytoene synthase
VSTAVESEALVEATPDELKPAFAAARNICRRHARSFYFASFFLPPRKRDAAYAVYAFCRMIDDAIDLPHDESFAGARGLRHHPAMVSPRSLKVLDPAPGRDDHCSIDTLENRLAMLRDRLDEMYDGRLELPAPAARSEAQHALRAFTHTVHRYEIPKQYFMDVAEGCRMDLTVARYATWADLENYCYHVAGVVGLIMSCVFGLRHSGACAQAIAMGNAMQLTNILRDVKEDFDRGRIYLPQEDLVRFGYTENELARGEVNQRFRELMRFEIARARELYRTGAEGLCWLAGDGSRLTASAMAVIYSGILDAIERQDYDVFAQRAHLTTPQKFRRLPAAWRLARRESGEPLPRLFR